MTKDIHLRVRTLTSALGSTFTYKDSQNIAHSVPHYVFFVNYLATNAYTDREFPLKWKQIRIVMTSASDIMRLRRRLGASGVD